MVENNNPMSFSGAAANILKEERYPRRIGEEERRIKRRSENRETRYEMRNNRAQRSMTRD
jgi:hypothetical protein